MLCLFCGKELGFLQELTDGDFCSKQHRKRYSKLTRNGVDRLRDAAETPCVLSYEAEPSGDGPMGDPAVPKVPAGFFSNIWFAKPRNRHSRPRAASLPKTLEPRMPSFRTPIVELAPVRTILRPLPLAPLPLPVNWRAELTCLKAFTPALGSPRMDGLAIEPQLAGEPGMRSPFATLLEAAPRLLTNAAWPAPYLRVGTLDFPAHPALLRGLTAGLRTIGPRARLGPFPLRAGFQRPVAGASEALPQPKTAILPSIQSLRPWRLPAQDLSIPASLKLAAGHRKVAPKPAARPKQLKKPAASVRKTPRKPALPCRRSLLPPAAPLAAIVKPHNIPAAPVNSAAPLNPPNGSKSPSVNLSTGFVLAAGVLHAVRPCAAAPKDRPRRQLVSLASAIQQSFLVKPSVSRESVLGFNNAPKRAIPIMPDFVQPASRMHVPFAFLEAPMPPRVTPIPDSRLDPIGNFPRVRQAKTPAPVRKARSLLQTRKKIPSWAPSAAAAILVLLMLKFVVPPSRVATALENRIGSIRTSIQQRAALVFADDFQAGMDDWEGSRNWARSWSFHRAGYTSPGRLALYRPSTDLADYRLEFLAQIDRKGVGWVTRATDLKNYYVTKLLVVKPGPRPMLSLVRYPVIDGKKGPVAERPIRMMLHNNTPYRFSMDVQGNQFSFMIEGAAIDSWSDEVQQTGAIGFFTDRGERARLYWMRLAYQDDMVGRMCARLTPVLAMTVSMSSRVRASN